MEINALENRLDNWGRAQRVGAGHKESISSKIYSLYTPGRTLNSTVDSDDANQVELAWRTLMPLDKKVLKMHYIWQAPAPIICRRLGLKIHPASIFDCALSHARNAIEARLKSRPIQWVSMKSIIDHIKEGVELS